MALVLSRTSIKINSLCETHDVLESWNRELGTRDWRLETEPGGHTMEMSFLQGDLIERTWQIATAERGVWQMYCLLFAFSIYFFIPFLAPSPST